MSLRRAAFLSLVLSTAALQPIEPRDTISSYSDDPLFHTQANFVARRWHKLILVGDYMYIDGGEIYYKQQNGTIVHLPTADTYSIDMSSSWTNDTVSMTEIQKAVDGAHLSGPNLFQSLDNHSFYSYNGNKYAWYDSNPVPANKLYKFTADGTGSGKWSEDNSFYTADSNFTQLARVAGAASACGPDTCYAMGGYRDGTTGTGQAAVPASGLVSYNMTSQVWNNDTLPSTAFAGPWSGGKLLFTDVAGSKGMLIAIGGSISGQTAFDLPYDYVYLYDIESKNWYKQRTTGDVPAIRYNVCGVGIRAEKGANSTFEVFIYGGWFGNGPGLAYDDVWVLSLPSFEWYQAGHTPVRGRTGHSCTIAGQRQMLIVGGLPPNANDPPKNADIWPLGLGVFDLSQMVFKDRFDADASAYISPEVVSSWYDKNGYVTRNASEEVAQLFTKAKTSGSSNSTSNSNNDTSSANDGSSVKTGKSNAGAIVGGVVGAVVVIAAIVAGLWFFFRHRRRQRGQKQRVMDQNQNLVDQKKLTVDDTHEIDSRPRFEVGGLPQKEPLMTHESDSSQRHELG